MSVKPQDTSSPESMNTYRRTLVDIFKHLQESEIRNSMCNKDCFSVTDQVSTEYQLKITEAMHIK